MQANSAKCDPITVSLIVYDGVKLLDVTGPLQVFSDARFSDGSSAYRVDLVSVAGGSVSTDTVMRIDTSRAEDASEADTALVIGGRRALTARYDTDLLALARTISRTARRFCSVCLGAFVLAEAGLLDGRRAATHWSECDRLASDYPGVDVMENEIFVKDGNIWTSAGVTAGIDMSLALVEADLGREEALRIARSLVLPMKRQGGQSQFSATLRRQTETAGGRFGALLAAIEDDPGGDYAVPQMAERVNMSERNFARSFKAETGKSPARYVEGVRVEAARDALLDGASSLKGAAAAFGFGSEENMRRAFKRRLGATPSDVVQRFSDTGSGA